MHYASSRPSSIDEGMRNTRRAGHAPINVIGWFAAALTGLAIWSAILLAVRSWF